jgi:hypothetical protein
MTKAQSCSFLENCSNMVIRKFHIQHLSHRKFFQISRCRISYTSKVGIQLRSEFPSSHARRIRIAKSYLAVQQQADTRRNFHNSHYPYSKMLSFGENGHHNISYNFGIQRMIRFRCSIARKFSFPKPYLVAWTAERTELKIV